MEQKRISVGSVFDKLPPLSTNFPWFVAQNLKAKKDDDYIDNQIFYTLHNPEFHYRCQIPELFGRQIRACFHGWMILSNHPMWFVWNPITSKLIRLPPLRSTLEDDDYGCCLSSPPDDPSSIFMLTAYEKPTITFCRLDRKRKKLKWTEMSYAKQLRSITHEEEDCFLNNLTCCDGKGCENSRIASLKDWIWKERLEMKQWRIEMSRSPMASFGTVSKGDMSYVGSCFEYSTSDTVNQKKTCRLEGDHPDSKQEKDKNDDIEVKVVRDNEVQLNSTSDESHLLSNILLLLSQTTYSGRGGLAGLGVSHHIAMATLHYDDQEALWRGLDIFRKIGEYYSWQHDIAKPPPSTFGSSSRYLLAKCEQHILLVIMGKIGESVEVFRLIDSGKEWEKIDSLGKHAMYICDATCLCVEAAPKMKNKIYFPRLHPDNGKIVFYNLETCRYHTSSDQDIEESLGDLFRTTQHWNPHAWIEPSWS
ncbi:hypothetical protein Tco_0827387 [Tanacetum coccineum]